MNTINQYFILKDKRKLGFAQYGKSNGFPIIYCHGSQSSRLEMHYDPSFATDKGLRIITIDRPGHGISDFNQNGTILSFASDVNELTEHLEINTYSVVGMSAGAPFALAIAYFFPDKIHKVSIVSGFAPFNRESKKYLSKEVKSMLHLAKLAPCILKVLLNRQKKLLDKNPKKVLHDFLKIMSNPDQEALKNQSILKTIETMFKEAFRNGSQGVAYEISNLLVHNWGFESNKIRVPVTFWHGEKDTNVPPEWAEIMAKTIRYSNLKKYPNEGHLIIFKHAKEIFTSLIA